MQLREIVRIAITALRANKLRSLLTMLGIIIGVSAVISMLALGNGFSRFLSAELNQLGVGVFYITPSLSSDQIGRNAEPRLTAADAQAILRSGRAPSVRAVAVEYSGRLPVSAGGERYRYEVKGVSQSLFRIRAVHLSAGRLFTQEEADQRARVALIGRTVASTLFGGHAAALGRRISINGVSFEVIGVTSAQAGGADGGDPTRQVTVPYETAVSRLFRAQITPRVDVIQVTVQAVSRERVRDAIAEVTALLRERHRLSGPLNDFSILNLEQVAQQTASISGGFNLFLGCVAGISLLVGGIGIMNIMLVSVTERTREIGLRKAVGARGRDILLQFLVEAVVLSLIGCAIGIAIGYGLAPLGTLLLAGLGTGGGIASVPLSAVALATGVSIVVGVVFGIVPAIRAARLNPIQALRSE